MTLAQRAEFLAILVRLQISLPGVPGEHASAPCATCEHGVFGQYGGDQKGYKFFQCLKLQKMDSPVVACSKWLPAIDIANAYGEAMKVVERPSRDDERLSRANNCHACSFCTKSPNHHDNYNTESCVLLGSYQKMPEVVRIAGDWPSGDKISRCSQFIKIPEVP